MDLLIENQKKELAAHTFGAQVTKDERLAAKQGESNFFLALTLTVLGVAFFFWGNIHVQRYRYPTLYKWYEDFIVHAKVKGEAAPGTDGAVEYSMDQVIVARDFPPVQTLFSIGIWKDLSQMSADFLLTTVAYFQDNPYVGEGGPSTRNRLTSVHWSGGFQQWDPPATAEMIVGTKGFLCGGLSGDEQTVKNQIVKQWIWSKHGPNKDLTKRWNIWYDFFPDPELSQDAFLQVPVVMSLYSGSKKDEGAYADPCSSMAKSESNLYQLLAGGLCYVAKQEDAVAMSSGQLFEQFFGSGYTHASSCVGNAAMGAVSGAGTAAMSALGLMPLLGPELTILALAAGGGGGAAGAYFTSKGKCTTQSSSEDPDNEIT